MTEATTIRLVELALGAATVLALVWIAAPERGPWAVVAGCARRVVGSWRPALYLGACVAVIAVNYLYLTWGIDAQFTAWVVDRRGADFAELIHQGIEGDAVARLQAAVAWPPLTWLLGYAYVVVFPCLVLVAMMVFDHSRDRYGLALVLAGYLLNYVLALPFYVLVPVRETFVYYQQSGLGEPAARLLLDDISPVVMEVYRGMSGVDNCFPSLHTSLSVTMALVAWHGGRRLGWLMTVCAGAVVLSTVYLGVHWLTDVAAGLVAGAAAYGLARLVARRWRAGGCDG